MSFSAPAESPQFPDNRGVFRVREDGGSQESAAPHTATGAEEDGGHKRQRVLAVKLDLRGDDGLYQRLKDLSWQAARYRNLYLRARWAEAKHLCVDPEKNIPHDVTKWIRADEKMELSGAAYSAAEREVAAVWKRHSNRILAGGPLPEWKPTAALSIRGHKNQRESGVRLAMDDRGRLVAHLQAQADKCANGSWLHLPVALGTARDYQIEMLRKMAAWEIPISKATVIVQPGKHAATLRLAYALEIPLPRFGNRTATLGPIRGDRLLLRTECDTRDFSGRLHTILDRKENWDLIRRRVMAQIGRSKGSARKKRKVLARMSWQNWLTTTLHQWSREIIDWLHGQGVAKLTLAGLEGADWPVFRFTEMLTYKGEVVGIQVDTLADLADESTERTVKAEIQHKRRRATKAGKAIRELTFQHGGGN